jgi:predicted enzyme related to lactoylglutathione lyase
MNHPVMHFIINVYKAKHARTFYQRLFGWKISPVDKKMAYAGIRKTGTGGISGGIAGTNSRGVTMYVGVKNVAETLKKVKKVGGKVTRKPVTIPGMGTIGWFRDPAGNEIGVWAK